MCLTWVSFSVVDILRSLGQAVFVLCEVVFCIPRAARTGKAQVDLLAGRTSGPRAGKRLQGGQVQAGVVQDRARAEHLLSC